MTTTTIIEELEKLPLADKLLVIERTLKFIRQNTDDAIERGVQIMYDEYKTNAELTIFTQLDSELFYEARHAI